MSFQFARPLVSVDGRRNVVELRIEIQSRPVDVAVRRHKAKWALGGTGLADASAEYPLQHAHVLAETRPHESTICVLSKPIDAEDARRIGDLISHRQPMPEIVADVIAAKGQHRKGIATYFADGAGGRRGRFGSH